MAKYIVLRDLNAGRRRTLESFGPGMRAGGGMRPDPDPAVSTHDLGQAEMREVSRDPSVIGMARAMPTKLIRPFAGEATASAGPTWGVEAVGATASGATGSGVLPCILDTGIDASHPAFAGVDLVQRDFTGSGNGDRQGHGSHCAGTVFGRNVGGMRIGVAPGVERALIGKVLGDDGSGGSEMLFDAMQWASEQGAQVISMSLGFDFPGLVKDLVDQGWPVPLASSAALEAYRMNLQVFNALMRMMEARAAFNGGTVVVAASGNESERQIDPNFEVSASLPAASIGVISVGAAQQGDAGLTIADFSNTNPVLAAPGVDVLSAQAGGGLVAFKGTSMACPHVAGVACLWWEEIRNRGIPVTAEAVAARLRASAVTNVFAPGVDMLDRGEGFVQAPRASVS